MKQWPEVVRAPFSWIQERGEVFQIVPIWASSSNSAITFPGRGYNGGGVYLDGGSGRR